MKKNPRYKIGDIVGGFTIIDKISKGPYVIKCNNCAKVSRAGHGQLKDRIETGAQKYCKSCNLKVLNSNTSRLITSLYPKYKSGAKARGYTFEISKNQFGDLIQQPCAYCGNLGSNLFKCNSKNCSFVYNGMDRVNNSLGYIYTNLVPCCKQCNIAKHNHSLEDFLTWIKRVHDKTFRDYPYMGVDCKQEMAIEIGNIQINLDEDIVQSI